MTRPRIGHALLLLPLLAVAVWLAARGRATRDDPGAVLAALRTAAGPSLPAAGEAAATARSEPETYTRDTLYEYIDGGAEAYLARSFQRCVTATYSFAPAGALDVTAEVYRFATPADAAAQLAIERPSDATPVSGVAGAFADATTLLASHGGDYLKLTALTAGGEASRAMVRIVQAWQRESP